MEVLPLLIAIALVLVVIMIAAFFWAVKSGQFDDLEGPAHQILMDDEPPNATTVNKPGAEPKTDSNSEKKT